MTCSGNPEEDPRAGQASNREVAEGKRYLRNEYEGQLWNTFAPTVV
jgi:hypothetical protein